jgi:diguanylate cyclase (GGDEF)-like protein
MFGLQGKIILILSVVLLLTTGVHGYFSVHIFEREYTKALASETNIIAENLKSQLDRIMAIGIDMDDMVGFEVQCKEIIEKYPDASFAAVLDPHGIVRFHSDESQMNTLFNDQAVVQLVKNGLTSRDTDVGSAIVPVKDPSGLYVGSVVVGTDGSAVRYQVAQMTSWSFMLSVLFFVLTLTLIYFALSFWVTQPLRYINRLMDEAARGNLSVKVRLWSHDEIGQVGRTFQNMLQQIVRLLQETARTAQLEQAVQSELKQRKLAESLRQITHTISSTLDMDQVLERSLDSLATIVQYNRVSIWVKQDDLVMLAKRSLDQEEIYSGLKQDFKELLGGSELIQKRLVRSDGLDRGVLLLIPLYLHHEVKGMLALEKQGDYYSEQDVGIALTFAGQVGIAIQNAMLYSAMETMATTDELTGIWNRRNFMQEAYKEVERSRQFDHSFGVIIFDIDHFKSVNDGFGHPVGDMVLREVAHAAGQALEEKDMLGRIGGEEFAILLPECDLQSALDKAEAICQGIAGLKFSTHTGELQITASVGLAYKNTGDRNLGQLLRNADQALYESKSKGRNQVSVHEL